MGQKRLTLRDLSVLLRLRISEFYYQNRGFRSRYLILGAVNYQSSFFRKTCFSTRIFGNSRVKNSSNLQLISTRDQSRCTFLILLILTLTYRYRHQTKYRFILSVIIDMVKQSAEFCMLNFVKNSVLDILFSIFCSLRLNCLTTILKPNNSI